MSMFKQSRVLSGREARRYMEREKKYAERKQAMDAWWSLTPEERKQRMDAMETCAPFFLCSESISS